MRKFIILTGIIFCYTTCFAQERKLTELMNRYGIPGIQLVCLKGDKEIDYNLGSVSKESGRKVTSNTIFEAASLSKCVFAYAVLRLYDKGIINLDTPQVKY